MKNRRYDYRHTFEPAERLHVEITDPSGQSFRGRVINLCVAGMSLELEEDAPQLREDELCQTSLSLPRQTGPLSLESQVVHTQSTSESGHVGLRFLPLPDPEAHEERDRQLWLYLLEEQRRAIRKVRASRR